MTEYSMRLYNTASDTYEVLADGFRVTRPISKERAEYIVTACNAYPDDQKLIADLERVFGNIVKRLDGMGESGPQSLHRFMREARELLAKAKGAS